MDVTQLLDEGQVTLPKALCTAQHWEVGQELIAIAVGDGILLKPKKPFPTTTLAQVAGGCTKKNAVPPKI